MKIIDILTETRQPSFSFEIIPPARGRSITDVIEIVDCLMPLKPKWFAVTSHSSSAKLQEFSDGTLRRKSHKKRPGSLGICGVIQNRFKVETLAHVLCLGFSREETEDALIELSYLGVENVLLLRGDSPNFEKRYSTEKSFNHYATDLVRQVVDLRQGRLLEEISDSSKFDFCIGVAGYPEKHFAAANLDLDIQYLKQKVDLGANYVLTQMFFDNKIFYDFVAKCRAAGIKVPIVPSLKVVTSTDQIIAMPRTCHVQLPHPLVEEIQNNPEHVEKIGCRWAAKQVADLMSRGFLNVHFFVMNDAHLVKQVIETVD